MASIDESQHANCEGTNGPKVWRQAGAQTLLACLLSGDEVPPML